MRSPFLVCLRHKIENGMALPSLARNPLNEAALLRSEDGAMDGGGGGS